MSSNAAGVQAGSLATGGLSCEKQGDYATWYRLAKDNDRDSLGLKRRDLTDDGKIDFSRIRRKLKGSQNMWWLRVEDWRLTLRLDREQRVPYVLRIRHRAERKYSRVLLVRGESSWAHAFIVENRPDFCAISTMSAQ